MTRTYTNTLLGVGLLGVTLIGGAAVASASDHPTNQNDGVCAGTHQTPPAGPSFTYTAPEGKLIAWWCAKAGSANQGDGPESHTVNPPAESVTISHSSGKDLSHFSVKLVDKPKPTTSTMPPDTTVPPTSTLPPTTTVPPTTEPPTTTVPPTTEPPTTTVPPTTTEPPTTTTEPPTTSTTRPPTTPKFPADFANVQSCGGIDLYFTAPTDGRAVWDIAISGAIDEDQRITLVDGAHQQITERWAEDTGIYTVQVVGPDVPEGFAIVITTDCLPPVQKPITPVTPPVVEVADPPVPAAPVVPGTLPQTR
jgi:hypothetical protein